MEHESDGSHELLVLFYGYGVGVSWRQYNMTKFS
jgi:hypothetical protein